jgi:hypothetical protein
MTPMADGREIRREKRETRKERSGSENGDGLDCTSIGEEEIRLHTEDDDGELDAPLPPDGIGDVSGTESPEPSSKLEDRSKPAFGVGRTSLRHGSEEVVHGEDAAVRKASEQSETVGDGSADEFRATEKERKRDRKGRGERERGKDVRED